MNHYVFHYRNGSISKRVILALIVLNQLLAKPVSIYFTHPGIQIPTENECIIVHTHLDRVTIHLLIHRELTPEQFDAATEILCLPGQIGQILN